ncbi:MAG: hypothetical protein GY788_07930 [bacterium]|nr:hypothetical protein [bacterium]
MVAVILSCRRRATRVAATALIGLAALVHDDGDADWAAEIIMRAVDPQTTALHALGRAIAARIGVRDEFVQLQVSAVNSAPDATEFLKTTLARLDEPNTSNATAAIQA